MTMSFPTLFISLPEGIIDLGWGHPSLRLHPLGALQQAATHAFAHTQTAMLQYGAATYGERVHALVTALREYLPGDVRFAIPGGGYFVWLSCGEDVDTEALLPGAQQAGVSYRPGAAFSAARAFPHALRLSFALYEVDELVQGAERLARALTLYRAASPSPSRRSLHGR